MIVTAGGGGFAYNELVSGADDTDTTLLAVCREHDYDRAKLAILYDTNRRLFDNWVFQASPGRRCEITE
ncbi:hypothetical protein KX816_01875 [Sphingosinicellaceae bacterium]|nr:hypothetical protein KX816_01875 [Sphingosinicellaceae bacterium]